MAEAEETERCLEWSRTAFISRWLGPRISSWLAQKCSTSEKSERTARSRSKCRLVAQGFWQVEGVHYTEKYSPTPATTSIRILLAMAAARDGELRHFDAEQAFLKAGINE